MEVDKKELIKIIENIKVMAKEEAETIRNENLKPIVKKIDKEIVKYLNEWIGLINENIISKEMAKDMKNDLNELIETFNELKH